MAQHGSILIELPANDGPRYIIPGDPEMATVDEKAHSQPFLLSIGERAEALALAYEDRHLTTQEVLAEFERLFGRALQAEVWCRGTRRKRSGGTNAR